MCFDVDVLCGNNVYVVTYKKHQVTRIGVHRRTAYVLQYYHLAVVVLFSIIELHFFNYAYIYH